MNLFAWRSAALVFLCAAPFCASAAGPAPAGFPNTDETLNYSVNWPSRLSLGEAHLKAKHAGANWDFEMTLDAAVPGFAVKGLFDSSATADLCSLSFERALSHGTLVTDDKETIDPTRKVARRITTKGGGASEITIPACAKDALTFLFYTRRELGQGRVPPAQQILYGGLYQIQLEYAGAQSIPIGGAQVLSDKMICAVKGPASSITFEMYFARDPARTPLLIKVPLAMGSFSMELVR